MPSRRETQHDDHEPTRWLVADEVS